MGPRAFLLPLGFSALSLISVGCSSSNAAGPPTESSDAASFAPPDADIDDAVSTPDAGVDAAPSRTSGSPLCNASIWMGCFPDDARSATAQDCFLAPDGGAYNAAAGYDNVELGCHVRPVSGGAGVLPTCTPPGQGTDGMPCDTGEDCAPSYECVGDGTCRHYCCSGSCADPDDFCDIQTAVDTSLKVPACVPTHRCNLLDSTVPGSCSPGQTCEVVRNNGATSCVAIGPRQAGEECNTDHCAAKLTCIGNAGDRTCFALCHTSSKNHDCPSGQTCTGGLPLFPVPGVGICK